ncbi:MAG: hypothetical protein K0Q66_2103 [Chitinophagaceae bacterium]|jgi:hypothetical protein|nr:hypothetical protein [Chitinophagaceae bacterium]
MEPEVKAFLLRIVKSLSFAILWMMLNMTFGIFFDLGYIHSTITIGNILYYIFLVGSFSVLLWYLLKLWKEDPQV